MSVIHILKDGTQVKDITGYVIHVDESSPLYHVIDSINRGNSKNLIHTNISK